MSLRTQNRQDESTEKKTNQGTDRTHRSCPDCDTGVKQTGGEWVCPECGVVLDDLVVDHGPEWRAYNQQERQKKSRVGAPNSLALHDRGIGSVIGDGNAPKKRPAAHSDKVDVLKVTHSCVSGGDSDMRRRRFVFGEAHRIASELDLPRQTVEETAYILRRCQANEVQIGRSWEGVVGAAILIACRHHDLPVLARDVVEFSRLDDARKKIFRCLSKIKQKTDVTVPLPPEPIDLVPRFLSMVSPYIRPFDDIGEFRQCVRRLIRYTEERTYNGSPETLTVAAIFYVAKQRGLTSQDSESSLTQDKISEITGVSQVTIRNTYQEFL
jgi:transcription initiation factor TFIIB